MANTTQLGTMVVNLVGQSASYQKMLTQAQQQATAVASQVTQAGKKIEALSNNLGTFAAAATAALGGITGGLGVTNAFKDFDAAMAYSTSVMGLTAEKTDELRSKVLGMAAQTGKSAEQLAKSFYYMASAGLNAEQAFVALPAYLKFATAGQMELAEAVDLSSGVMGAARLGSEDAAQNLINLTRVTDVLAKMSVLANGNIKQFAEALANDAAAAGTFAGKKIEETGAVIAAFAKSNNRGAAAGSDYARMITYMSKAVQEAGVAHKRLGFSVFDAEGKMRNMADIAENLEKILGKMSPEERSMKLKEMGFDFRVQGPIKSIIGMSSVIRLFQKELENAGGTTEDVSKKVGDTLAASFTKLQNTVTLVGIEIGKVLAPALRTTADTVKGMIRWWLELSDAVKTTTVAVTMLTVALLGLGPVAKAAGLLSPLFVGMFGPLRAVIAFLSNPAIWTVGIMAAWTATMGWLRSMGRNPLIRFAAAAGLVALALHGIATAVQYGIGDLHKLNDELDRGVELSKQLATTSSKKTESIVAKSEGISGQTEKSTFLAKEIEKAQKDVTAYVERVDAEKKKLADESMFTSVGKSLTSWLPGMSEAAKEETRQLDDAKSMLESSRQRVDTLQKELKKVSESETFKKMVQGVDALETSLRDQIATAGKSENEIARYRLTLLGATDAQLKMVDALIKEAKAADEKAKAKKDTEELTKSLQEQVATFNLTSHEADVYKLSLRGVGDEELKMAKDLAEGMKYLEEQKKAFEKGKDVTKEFAKPQEKFAAKQKEMGELLRDGAISFDTYARAIEDARKELEGTRKELEKFDSATTNSMEGLARITAFKDLMSEQSKNAKENAANAKKYAPPGFTSGDDLMAYEATGSNATNTKPVPPPYDTSTITAELDLAALAVDEFKQAWEDFDWTIFDEVVGKSAKASSSAATEAAAATGAAAQTDFMGTMFETINGILGTFGLGPDTSVKTLVPNPVAQGNGPIEQPVAMVPSDANTQESILDVLKGILKTNEEMLKKPDLDIGTAGLA
jgi:TP901 family phage tail tape measure protein